MRAKTVLIVWLVVALAELLTDRALAELRVRNNTDQTIEVSVGESVFLHGRRLSEQATAETAKVVANYCEKIGLKTQ